MTRLRVEDLEPIRGRLEDYDAHLKRMTGASLRQIACHAAGVDEALIIDVLEQVLMAAVPVTTGLGIIGGFSPTVAAITSHLGFRIFVTEASDEAGFGEGVERGAEVIMLADDESFVALTPGRKHLADNSLATAQGFVAGLELMKGGLEGESVLVLGCGPLGMAGAKALLARGASVSLCDIVRERALAAQRELGQDATDRIRMEDLPSTALTGYDLIFDATNAGGFIEPTHLSPDTLVAAPGMPFALTPEAMAENRDRILHDALEIGTATMAVQAVVMIGEGAENTMGHEE